MSESGRTGTVVIGVGNPLMGDDGLGLSALSILRDQWTFDPPIELLDGGTWGMNLLPHIEDAGRLLLIDAINIGAAPGTPVVLERAEIPRFVATKLSPHQIDLREVLALAELRGTLPDEMVAIGLQPERVEMSTELSPAVQDGVGSLIGHIIQRLDRWGHRAQPTSNR